MTNELHIAPGIAIPDEAVTRTIGIVAQRGMGKTYTSAVVCEEMAKAGLPVVIIDPLGVWWGLRVSADGNGPGLPIAVFGGEHADIPITPDAGEAIARAIAEETIPAVIDLSGFRKEEQARFMLAFAETIYHVNRSPLHLVLDEADLWAPQRPLKGRERLLGAIEDIVRRGRVKGLGMTMITQRPAVLNKNILTQIELMIVLRLVAPQDRQALDAWINVFAEADEREQFLRDLPKLPRGTAYLWSPGWLGLFTKARIRERETFDSSATPKMGESRPEPKTLADVDLTALQARIAEVAERAAADDPKSLRKKIAELEQRLAATERTASIDLASPLAEISRMKQQIFDANEQAMLSIWKILDEVQAAIRGAGSVTMPAWRYVTEEITVPEPKNIIPIGSFATVVTPPESRSTPEPRSTAAEDLPDGARRMLEALGSMPDRALTRRQVATLAGMAESGTFSSYIKRLRTDGYIEVTGAELRLTAAGRRSAGAGRRVAPTSWDLVEIWSAKLRTTEGAALEMLVRAYPKTMHREELARALELSPTSGTFAGYLKSLRQNGLAENNGPHWKAAGALFLGDPA